MRIPYLFENKDLPKDLDVLFHIHNVERRELGNVNFNNLIVYNFCKFLIIIYFT